LLKKLFKIASFIALLATMPSNAHAACKHGPIPWRFGDSITSEWKTDDKSVCTSTNFYPKNISRIEIETRPQHGSAGKAGPFAVAYKPKPGFHGSDTFMYAVFPNNARMPARITVFVTVQ
jgi:hypothetical protein